MQPHILTIPDDGVYEQLVQLAAAAGLHIAEDGLVSKSARPATRTRAELIAIIQKGGSGTSITDPLGWQREQRKDEDLPFHVLKSTIEQ